MRIVLTVYFDNPFWVGVFERYHDDKLSVSKVTFGAEPTDVEVYSLILEKYDELKFSPSITTELKQRADNPKRRLKAAKKQLENVGIGTKSQQAIKRMREEMKIERVKKSKEQKTPSKNASSG